MKQKGWQKSFQHLNKKGIFQVLDLWKSILQTQPDFQVSNSLHYVI